MSERITIALTAEQHHELEAMRDRHKLAYLRERATAILKVGNGQSPHDVAQHGLLKARDPDTVYEWVRRYKADGLAGLRIKQGRGRKPAFSPSAPGRRQCQARPAARPAARPGVVRAPREPVDARAPAGNV